jgi:UDP-N-acetylmuramyl pentapeptide synthase
MMHTLKKRLYFALAGYFVFWARIALGRWKPQVIVITGSSGKTTLLHLAEAQIGDKAKYSHHANGAYGIPFDILGMTPNVASRPLWLWYIIRAPFLAWLVRHEQNVYVVEADCDRPREGKLLAELLKPEVCIWLSVYHTHSMNFDGVVQNGAFKTHIDAIAHEFGYFAENTSKLMICGNQPEIASQLSRVSEQVQVAVVKKEVVEAFEIRREGTSYKLQGVSYRLGALLPPAIGQSIAMVGELMHYLGLPHNPESYQKFRIPPGRSSIFSGVHNTVLIDSTYNTGRMATKEVLDMFAKFPAQEKWLVLGDIQEQGNATEEEHKKLAELVASYDLARVVLLGHRLEKYSLALLRKTFGDRVTSYKLPSEVLSCLQQAISGSEAILFKGAMGLEGVIEQLLQNPADEKLLVRRGKKWQKRRQAWGLPR